MQYEKDLYSINNTCGQSSYLISAQLEPIRCKFPELYDCIDLERVAANTRSAVHDSRHKADFETEQQGGRGELYTLAQRDPLVRRVGITGIFTLAAPEQNLQSLYKSYKILDALGGDGILTRALSNLLPFNLQPSILTSDISEYMISSAQAYGLPALQQPVQSLTLKDNSFDAVIIAYGSHHIPLDQRLEACQEAFRVLKPGGRIVFHDFENDSPVTTWFRDVVHPYSLTGHNFFHYTSEELKHYFMASGFNEAKVEYLYDPFIFSGKSPQKVKYMLGEHLLNMYGLVKLADERPDQDQIISAYTLAERCFRYNYSNLGLALSFGASCIRVFSNNGDWFVEMPRVALVGTAVKP